MRDTGTHAGTAHTRTRGLATVAGASALVFALAVMAGAAGCGGAESVDLTQSSDGTTVSGRVGDAVVLTLPENPTTGYAWEIETSDGLRPDTDEYLPDDTSGESVGAGGTHRWEFTITEGGEQTIAGVYRRSWEQIGRAHV